MPIELNKFYKIKETKIKKDKDMLKFMHTGKRYTTNDIQKFLEINHTATLQRLKKLVRQGFLKLHVHRRIYNWEKIKDIEEEEITGGYKFYV